MTALTKPPEISDEVLEGLLKDYEKPEDFLGPDGIFKALKRRMIEKALGAELARRVIKLDQRKSAHARKTKMLQHRHDSTQTPDAVCNYLGYEKSDPAGNGSGNSRNGASKKTSPVIELCQNRTTPSCHEEV